MAHLCVVALGPASNGIMELGEAGHPLYISSILGQVPIMQVVLYCVMEQYTVLNQKIQVLME